MSTFNASAATAAGLDPRAIQARGSDWYRSWQQRAAAEGYAYPTADELGFGSASSGGAPTDGGLGGLNIMNQLGGSGGAGGAATTSIDPASSTLSPNFASYVYNMLGKGEAAANLPFQEFTGQRFAGPSGLQQQAFQGLGSLQTPSQFGTATNFLTQAGQQAGGMGYTPSTFGNFFQGPSGFQPTTFGAGYNAPQIGGPTQFQNQFQAPQAYTPGTDFTQGIGGAQYQAGTFSPGFNYQPGQISTGLGPVGSVESYMNPYMSAVTDPAVREARRQADISAQSRGAQFAKAGAFGGARQAIEQAEAERNLQQQIGDIQSRGLQSAYDRALAQRAQEAQLGLTAQQAQEQARQFGAERGAQFGLQAQQAGEASRQFGAQFGMQGINQLLEARRAQEQARQFGAQQGLTSAQLQAQYGLSAQQAQEAARQFNAGQQMTAAQLQAQFGLDAQKASDLSRQFAAQQAMQGAQLGAQYGLAGAQAGEQSRQFGANLGLNALQQQLAAGQALGSLGTQQSGAQLAGLQALLGAGGIQQQLAQQPLDFGYQQFQESMKYPFQQATYMQSLLQGLPLQARGFEEGQSGLTAALQGGLSGLALYNLLQGKQP